MKVNLFSASPLESMEFIIAASLLALALLAGAVVIFLADRWRKQRLRSTPSEGLETLSLYRELNRRGELSDEEYKAIRARLAARNGTQDHVKQVTQEKYDHLTPAVEPQNKPEPTSEA